tara:strand:- start:501 stop:1361 length:861 start_codon:yes stop_codon:yes gene_type:complete
MNVLPRATPGSTQYNSKIDGYDSLALRIRRQLGEPLINIEVANEQIYDHIAIAMEYFTKYAGYTEEYLVFDSKLYTRGVGIRVDQLINKTPEMYSTTMEGLSTGYDYDLESFRRVLDCFAFEKGEDTGINTLFTLEQAMAQQIYSSYMVGNFGFDLVTWEVLKGFIDTRNKVLAMTPQFRFDPRTQLLRILPEPKEDHTYLGVVGCYIEKPIRDLIMERWIFRYAMALTKIQVANVRGKYKGTNMFGGGSINADDFMSQGIQERDTLEDELKNKNEDLSPATFFIG